VSKFSEDVREQHAEANNLGPGWCVKSASGVYDREIEKALAKKRVAEQRRHDEARRTELQQQATPPNWKGTPLQAAIENAKKKGAHVADSWFRFEGEAEDGAILMSAPSEKVRQFIDHHYLDVFSHHPDGRPLRWVEAKSQAAAA